MSKKTEKCPGQSWGHVRPLSHFSKITPHSVLCQIILFHQNFTAQLLLATCRWTGSTKANRKASRHFVPNLFVPGRFVP